MSKEQVDRLPIYRIKQPKADGYLAQDVARRALGIREFRITESHDGGRIRLRSGSRVVEIDAASEGVWAADESAMWNPDRAPDLPAARKAADIGEGLLIERGLLPHVGEKAPFAVEHESTGGTFAAIHDIDSGERIERQLDVQVTHTIRMMHPVSGAATLPVVGGGGKFTITLGEGGEPLGYHGVWRPLDEVALEAPAIPKAEVDRVFEQRMDRFELESYDSFLAYYSAPVGRRQQFLYPVYVYRAVARIGEELVPLRIVTLPATTFGPKMEPALPQPKRKPRTRPFTELIVNPRIVRSLTLSRRGVRTVNPFESGASWIGLSGGLAGSQNNARGFIDQLAADGWQTNFNWGDGNAWESDWRRNDDTWVDAADFVFYTGHANMNGWVLSNPDDTFLHFTETGGSEDRWGQQDLEWVIIAACGPLQDEVIAAGGGDVFDRWRDSFDGLHLLLGYGGVTFDNEEEGETVIQYAREGTPLIDAWFRTAKEIQPSTNGSPAPDGPDIYVGAMYAYRSGTTSPRNDHLWGHGSVAADPTDANVRVCMWTKT